MSSVGEKGSSPARPATGTAEDLAGIIIAADKARIARDGLPVPAKRDAHRALLEAPLNLAGRALALAFGAAPASWIARIHEAGLKVLTGGVQLPFDRSGRLAEAEALLRGTEARAGKEAALFALISHGPVHGELAYMNLELVRHAQWVLRSLRPTSRPRLVVAVDPFALDTLSLVEESLYAGFMGHHHLGIDRSARSRGALSSRFLAVTAWDRMPLRLLKGLAAGGAFAMALAGGIPATARGRYTAREWLARQRRRSPGAGDPAGVLARLRGEASYRAFEKTHPGWVHPRSAWRSMEAWLLAALEEPSLSGGNGRSSTETGALSGPARDAALRCLSVLGIEAGAASSAMAELEAEFLRETPYRARFFRVAASRVLARGRPIVFVPVAHAAGGEAAVRVGRAWAWEGFSGGRIAASRAEGPAWEGTPEEFAATFGGENFG